MADSNHRPEPAPAKVKYPAIRQLTVLETVCESVVKIRGVGLNYTPVHLEPCIVLRGKWLRQAGFTVGKKVTITTNQHKLVITPTPDSPDPVAKQ